MKKSSLFILIGIILAITLIVFLKKDYFQSPGDGEECSCPWNRDLELKGLIAVNGNEVIELDQGGVFVQCAETPICGGYCHFRSPTSFSIIKRLLPEAELDPDYEDSYRAKCTE